MIQCPNCKHEIDDSDCRPRICDQCGANLQAAQAPTPPRTEASAAETEPPLDTDDDAASGGVDYMDQMGDAWADGVVDRQEFTQLAQTDHSASPCEESLTENELIFLEKAKAAWADDKLTVQEVKELGQLQKTLGISDTRVSQLQTMAMESPRPDDDACLGEARPGLALEINVNRFYMEGFKGVLDLKLANIGLEDLDSVMVEVSSDLLNRTETWHCPLACGRAVFKKFQVKADLAGVELIRFRILAQAGEQMHAFWAETDIPVFERTQDLRNISIQADNIVGVGSVAENAKSMGNAVRGQMDALIRMDKIKNATDLMREYRKMSPSYRRISLEYDPERSRQHGVTRPKSIVSPSRGSLTEAASLALKGQDRLVNVLLLAKAEVHLGKHRSSDIVTRMLPRSAARDEQSNRMSRRHCRIELTARGVFVTDNQTANGTCLDGEPLVAEHRQITRSNRIIELGGVLPLEVSLTLDSSEDSSQTPYNDLEHTSLGELWASATRARINALTLCRYDNLGAEDTNGYERYCLIYRWATLGSDTRCAICIANSGLEPLHAALVYLNSRFYLENRTDLNNVSVNEVSLARDELTPLAFGDTVRIADLEMEFAEKRQVFVDYHG